MSRAWTSSTLMSLKKYFSIIISCRAVYGLKITKIKPKDLPSSSALLFFSCSRDKYLRFVHFTDAYKKTMCKHKGEILRGFWVNEQRRKLAMFLSYWTKFCALSFQFFKNSTGIRWWSRRVKKCVSKSGSGSNSNRNSEWKNQRHTPRDCIRRKEEEKFVTC